MNWDMVGTLIGVLLAFGGFLVASVKWLLDKAISGLDRRFSALDSQHQAEADKWRQVERDLMALRAELPVEYVRREDWVRLSSQIEAKLDSLNNKVDLLRER